MTFSNVKDTKHIKAFFVGNIPENHFESEGENCLMTVSLDKLKIFNKH